MIPLRFAAVSRNYFNMPIWIAQDTGLFADEGLAVEIELDESVDEVTAMVRDGRVQFAYGITEHVILDAEAGGGLKIVGGNVNKLPFSLIAGKDIASIADLRGKTIGVSSVDAGSSSLVMKILEEQGLSYPQDYDIRAVGPILTRWRMLQSGEIDAGLQGAPLDYIALDAGYPSICNPRESVPDFQFTSLNADRDWLAANDDIVARFMRAFVRAHAWFYGHREESLPIAAAWTGVEPDYLRRAWHEYSEEAIFPRDGDASTAAVQSLIDISALIRAVPDRSHSTADDYIDRQYLKQAQHDVHV